jgi:predicted nucleic acid-binding protein
LKPENRYWDSSVIIAYINEERGRVDTCRAILDDAEQGKIRIYTSALTITEVLKYKGAKPIEKDKKEILRAFFQNDYITIIQLDRWIAFGAQELVWENGIPPKDSLHVASALKAEVDVLETYDNDDLIKKSKTVGSPPLEIRNPKYAQLPLGLIHAKKTEQEEDKEEPETEE